MSRGSLKISGVTSLWQRRIRVCWLCQKEIRDLCLPAAAPTIPVAAGFTLQFVVFTLQAPDLFLCLRCYSRGKKRSLILSQQMKVLPQPNIYHFTFSHTANNHQNQGKITALKEVYTTSWGGPTSRQLGLKRKKCHPLSQNCKESARGLRRQDSSVQESHPATAKCHDSRCLRLSHSYEKRKVLMRAKSTQGTFQVCNTSSYGECR